jgi:hypothetical protein
MTLMDRIIFVFYKRAEEILYIDRWAHFVEAPPPVMIRRIATVSLPRPPEYPPYTGQPITCGRPSCRPRVPIRPAPVSGTVPAVLTTPVVSSTPMASSPSPLLLSVPPALTMPVVPSTPIVGSVEPIRPPLPMVPPPPAETEAAAAPVPQTNTTQPPVDPRPPDPRPEPPEPGIRARPRYVSSAQQRPRTDSRPLGFIFPQPSDSQSYYDLRAAASKSPDDMPVQRISIVHTQQEEVDNLGMDSPATPQ